MVDQLYLVRHGRTAYNAEGRFQGQVDIDLDELGKAQALSVAQHLRTAGLTKIVASDLRRAHHTALAIGEAVGLDVTTDEGLREISVGEWEGFTRAEIAERWPAEFEDWIAGLDVSPPGGERRMESNYRVLHAVERIVAQSADDDVLALVAHGSVIRGVTALMLGIDDASPGHLSALDNCEYAHFMWRRDRWLLRRWGGGAQ